MLERTCLACRKKAHKVELLRFVLDSKELLWDREQKKPGRGAYLHRDAKCCSAIRKASVWKRAFRRELRFELSQLDRVHGIVSRELGFWSDDKGSKSGGKIRL